MRFNLLLYAFTILHLHNVLIVIICGAVDIGIYCATDIHVMINIIVCIIHGACYTNERIIIQFRIHDIHVIIQMYLALIILEILVVVVIVIHVVVWIVHVVNHAAADANMRRRKGRRSGRRWRNSQWSGADAMNTSR